MTTELTLHHPSLRPFLIGPIENGFNPQSLHTYTDIQGNVLYWRIRLKHFDGRKWIRPLHQDANGEFLLMEPPTLKGKLKPLYRLDYLGNHPGAQVFVVEGEYPADCLNDFFEAQQIKNQYIAITSGSATSTDTTDWQPLSGKHCIIWPDNDEPGEKYANQVADQLKGIGCAVELVAIQNLGLPASGDCVDWIQENPSATLSDILKFCQSISPQNEPPFDEDGTISELVKLSLLEYDRVRITTAKTMGIRPTTLDNIIKAKKMIAHEENHSPFPFIEPWHEPINPAELLTTISNTIKNYIICQNETVTAATLWAAMTWFIDVIQIAPLAAITAPEKRCGKSQLLFLLSRIVNRPLTASNITSAALFRSIDAWQPTLLIDEADTFMRENEELRGLINCGHTRESAYTIRVVGEEHTPRKFIVWGAKALAGIGKLPDTIMDRSINLELRRKKPEETIERLRHADPSLFKTIASKLARFSLDYSDTIRKAKPRLPDTLNDRAQDNWEALFAIADIAGNEWVQLAQRAALKLSGDTDQSQSLGVTLLSDIHEIIEGLRTDRFSSADLVQALCKDEEKAWSTYYHGHPITPRQIANRLREFGIVSNTIRIGSTTAKGYLSLQFADAFERYLSPPSVTTSQPAIY